MNGTETVITIQRTSKNIKAVILLSWLGIIFGTVSIFTARPSIGALGMLLAIISLVTLIVAKIVRWWNHA